MASTSLFPTPSPPHVQSPRPGRSRSTLPPSSSPSSNADVTTTPSIPRGSVKSEISHDCFQLGVQTEQQYQRRSCTEGFVSCHPPSPTVWHAEASLSLPVYSRDMKSSQFLSTAGLGLHHVHDVCSDDDEQSAPRFSFNTDASVYSTQFPQYHRLNQNFVQAYQLEDELGCGGYGFVMTAMDRVKGQEVAVKFIIKEKVPEHAWMEDESFGRLPTEVVLLSFVHHKNVVKFIDMFEDPLYYYLVQELHGCPWKKDHKLQAPPSSCKSQTSSSLSTPALSPSSSIASLPASEPTTPPAYYTSLREETVPCSDHEDIPKLLESHLSITDTTTRPDITRRPSHDLFECIEQSENKRLTETQARLVFAQVIDVVEYLDSHGISHRDIKDENLVIDKNLKVKLIDFGSAIAVDPNEPPPYYSKFYGTAAYASSEILQKLDYQAAPAEVWTLGVLLSYLLAGISPFPNVRDAVDGRIFLSQKIVGKISTDAMDLMRRCLDPNPQTRATIAQIREHPWLKRRD